MSKVNERCHLFFSDDLEADPNLPFTSLEMLADLALQVIDILRPDSAAEISIQIASDSFVQNLNQTYRGVDAPTDILSFPSETLPPEIAGDEAPYLGDLVIAYPYTLHAAYHAHHAPRDEFALLVIHGILHLVGYDHDSPETQAIMWQKQSELLRQFDIRITVPDFIHGSDDVDDTTG